MMPPPVCPGAGLAGDDGGIFSVLMMQDG